MNHVFHRHARTDYPVADRGDGIHIVDTDGARYIDASDGAGLELVADRTTKERCAAELALNTRIKKAMDLGLMCYPMGGTIDGRRGDHVCSRRPSS